MALAAYIISYKNTYVNQSGGIGCIDKYFIDYKIIKSLNVLRHAVLTEDNC